MCREILRPPRCCVILLESVGEALEPLEKTLQVVICTVWRYDTLQDNKAVLDQLISPIPVLLPDINSRFRGVRVGVFQSSRHLEWLAINCGYGWVRMRIGYPATLYSHLLLLNPLGFPAQTSLPRRQGRVSVELPQTREKY